MASLSAFLYVVASYRLSLLFVLPLLCLGFALWLHRRKGRVWGYLLIPACFTLGLINVFAGPWINAAFLQWAGTPASARIVDRRDAGWVLNDQAVMRYDVLLRTADGQDVLTGFDSASVSIWPTRQVTLLPPANEAFIVKYVPGFPRNVVILSDESDYGKRWLVSEALRPVDRARQLHEASPDNPQFSGAYREALQAFLAAHHATLPDGQRSRYEAALAALQAAPATRACFYASRTQETLVAAPSCAQWENGRPVLSAQVLSDLSFDDAPAGLASVRVQDDWFWVRRDGYAQAVLTFDNGADDFAHGLVRGPGRDGMAYYDQELQPVLDTGYAWVMPFRDAYAVVCADCQQSAPGPDGHRSLEGHTWGVIDRAGKEVVSPTLSLQDAMAQQARLLAEG